MIISPLDNLLPNLYLGSSKKRRVETQGGIYNQHSGNRQFEEYLIILGVAYFLLKVVVPSEGE